MAGWSFVTNHTRVLLCIAGDPAVRHREIAEQVGVTERAVQRIVADLVEAGYLTVVREGRRNRYVVRTDLPFRHPRDRGHDVGKLLALLLESDPAARSGT